MYAEGPGVLRGLARNWPSLGESARGGKAGLGIDMAAERGALETHRITETFGEVADRHPGGALAHIALDYPSIGRPVGKGSQPHVLLEHETVANLPSGLGGCHGDERYSLCWEGTKCASVQVCSCSDRQQGRDTG